MSIHPFARTFPMKPSRIVSAVRNAELRRQHFDSGLREREAPWNTSIPLYRPTFLLRILCGEHKRSNIASGSLTRSSKEFFLWSISKPAPKNRLNWSSSFSAYPSLTAEEWEELEAQRPRKTPIRKGVYDPIKYIKYIFPKIRGLIWQLRGFLAKRYFLDPVVDSRPTRLTSHSDHYTAFQHLQPT